MKFMKQNGKVVGFAYNELRWFFGFRTQTNAKPSEYNDYQRGFNNQD